MDIRKYKVLLAVADYGNLTRAAEEMGYTQSGVSNLIKALEAETGFPLLRRHRRGVSLTEDGMRMLPVIRELVHRSEQLDQITDSIRGIASGTVRVASITGVSVYWLPRILKKFQEDYPRIKVKLAEGGDREVLKWVGEGRVDLGFCCDGQGESLEWLPLVEDELLAILPEDYFTADETVFPLTAFDGAPFIMFPEDYHCETKRLLEKHHIEPDVQFSDTDDHTSIAMVEEGLGLSIFSRTVMETYPHRRVKLLPLEPRCMRTLGVALRSQEDLSPAAAKFLATARNIIK